MARNAVVNLVIQGKDKASRSIRTFRGKLRGLRKSFFSLNNIVAKLAGTMALVFGARAVGRFFSGSIEAFKEQQNAVEGLRAALAATGRVGEDALDGIIEKAKQVQAVTTAGDEALIAATADLALLAKNLPAEELERSQEAVVAIADVFLKGDTRNAAQLLGKTLGSSTNALTRYGIEIDTTATQQEKLNQVLEQTAEMYEVSQAKAQTLEGRTTQLKNVFGDFREVVGEVIVDSLNMTSTTEDLTGDISDLTTKFEENKAEIAGWGRVAVSGVKLVAVAFKDLIRVAFNVGQILGRVIEAQISLVVGGIVKIIQSGIDRFNDLIEEFNSLPRVLRGGLPDIPLIPRGRDAGDAIDNARQKLEEMKGDISDIGSAVSSTTDRWDEFTTAVAEANEAARLMRRQTGAVPTEPPTTPPGGAGGEGEARARARLRGRGAGLTRAPRQEVLGAGLPMVPGQELPGVLGSAGFGAEFQENIRDTLGPLESLDQALAGIATGSLMQLQQGFEDTFAAVVSGSASAGEAAGQFALGFIGNVASGMSKYHFAQGVGKLAEGTWPPNPAALESAGKHFAASALFGALAGTFKGAGGRRGGAGRAGVGIGTGGLTRAQQDALNRPRGTMTVVFEGDYMSTNDPRFMDRFATLMREVGDRDVTVIHR